MLPYLAAAVTHNATYTQWTITARGGVKFHDGSPCNGDAIFANMQAVYNSSLTGPAVKAVIKSFTHTPGSSTVVINTKWKWTTLPYTLAEQQIGFIAEPSSLASGYSGLPIGTGPFVCQSWTANTAFVCTKNSQYWRPGLPYLGSVEMHPIPDGPTRLNALTGGSVDIIHEGDGKDLKAMKALPAGSYSSVIDFPGNPVYNPSCNCVMLNCSKAPFNNKALRTACAYAINRQSYVQFVDDNFSAPINGIYLKGSPYYKNPAYPAYNAAKAKTLVKALPSSVKSFTLTYVAGSSSVLEYATLVQNQLQAAGLKVTLNGVSQGKLIGAAILGGYQAVTWAQFGGVAPDLNYPWFSTKSGLNFARNFDSKIESLMETAFGETTASGREAKWGAVNNQIDKDIPYLWTDRSVVGVAAKNYVMNWKVSHAPNGATVLQPNQGVLFFTEVWHN